MLNYALLSKLPKSATKLAHRTAFMKKIKPLVSIVLPVCNSARFLKDCLVSLRSQTYKNFEIIAIDDKSSDNSLKILRQFKKRDKRVRVYKNIKRYGLAVCLNRGVRHAKGDFITFMNPNDLSAKSRLQRQVNFLLKNPKIVAVGTQVKFLNEANKELAKSEFPSEHFDIYKALTTGLAMHFESALINQRMIPCDLLRFKQTAYPFIFVEVLIKVQNFGEIANLPQALYLCRKTPKNLALRVLHLEKIIAFVKTLFKSFADYNYRPSIHSFLINPRILINK